MKKKCSSKAHQTFTVRFSKIAWMTGVTFCPPCHLTLTFEPHWQFSGLFVHEQALFCMYACASVRPSRGAWIRSGLWLSSAHAGHGALRPCIHSTLFSFPHLRYRCTKNVFSSLRIPAKKEKKAPAFTFTHTWIVAFHLIPNIFQLCSTAPPKLCSISPPALTRFGTRDKQTNRRWSFIKHIFPHPSLISEFYIYLGH